MSDVKIPSSPHSKVESIDRQERLKAELKRACQDFEAIFIQPMFRAMRKSSLDDGLFPHDTAHLLYRDLLDDQIASEIAHHQSLGLADQMYQQMEKLLSMK